MKIYCSYIECNKKLNLSQQISGKCKCNSLFCDIHRLNHDCSYNYYLDNDTEKDNFILKNKCIAKKVNII